MINFRMLKLSDPAVWLAVGGLLLFGFLAIFSATYRLQIKIGADPFTYVIRQFLALLVAGAGISFFAYLDYRHLQKAAAVLYGLTLVLLLVVLFGGAAASGAQRWIALGPLSFQPSELSKLTLIIILAAFLAQRQKVSGLWETGIMLALVGLPFLMIFKQPDLGTALVFIAIFVGMLAQAESSPRLLILLVTPFLSVLLRPILPLWLAYLAVLVLVLFLTRAEWLDWLLVLGVNIGVGVAVPYMWAMLKGYQQNRIIAFLNPAADPYGAGYHTMQSKIAIGGGGLFGKGFLHGSQTQLQFIPEQHSDFIFSVIGEEFGLLGSLLVVALFGVLIWRALVIADGARDRFGKMLASGVAVMLVFHVLANIGMALGLLPVVGIPLPLLSYGGSSLFMTLAALGILQSVAMRRHKLIF
ncbi:MAG: rod shape-determining protein RodA [Candidatus Margulisiibacteriota bacterium]